MTNKTFSAAQLRRYDTIRRFIETQGSQFISVSFLKKGGIPRTITYNPKAAKNKTQGAKSASSQQAIETRARNNPNLLNVWEHGNKDEQTKFRSINLDTVYEIAAGGAKISFTDVFEPVGG